MKTELIEKLISDLTDEVTELLYEDESEVFWVDWREDDGELAGYCESLINSGKLSSRWDGEDLLVQYGDTQKKVPLTQSGSDRHITLLAINEIFSSDYEVRLVWESDGSDTVAFSVLPKDTWNELEGRYGKEKVSKAFLQLTADLNTFTDPLYNHRPGRQRRGKWWQFWK